MRKASFLEDLYSERDNKLSNIEDLCNELENTIGLLCRLILVWSDKKESLLKIVYLMITNNDQTNIDPFKMLEYFILISDLLSKNFNQFHELNPENFENTPDFFGDLMRNFLERM